MNTWRKVSDEPAPEGADVYFTDGLTIWQANWDFDPDLECWWTTGAELLKTSGFEGALPLDDSWMLLGANSFHAGQGVWLLNAASDEIQVASGESKFFLGCWTHWQPIDKPAIRQKRPKVEVPTRSAEELAHALRESVAGRKP